ncbi:MULTISPECIES: TetR/AcrR family transcriptional regulator [Streptomycetaceae]|uniref:Transcriptional regulator, TetR family n=1 Tax=Streptantibioticus cattleyicolor (strain ATCC 35852 / DSM 46488 / JCM 4925 / NBRC 14057 / NRRL 8057) TaxID=1003195 RepID=F8JQF7_STREN|nr:MULTISPECIES: TetR/AcrR family transcriptional regulator [Streptomycetaceae]AEW97800.1 transcriptional regulator, TetR family [Streptantibioticus cattleyicolor NRRL 8057 = DSM 46488]MYS62218.1 TetR family transcriptional regulator [Streptomyces sp. SID5468]CCB78118.1 conserved protein of unknown function [Streptantibioticus cattleyicolor NRRL 8057 = DSM 46488]
MGRPRQFDEDGAVEAAMRAFWAAGYEATSTHDLCEATGLGRSSVYNTFSSKRDLYCRALRRYTERVFARQAAVLEGAGRVRERIGALFGQVVSDEYDTAREVEDPGVPGCFVVNSMVELGGRDPEVSELLARDLDRRLALLTGVFAAGQAAGEIDPAKSPRDLAHFVVATVSGMRVLARGGAPREALEGAAATALAAL